MIILLFYWKQKRIMKITVYRIFCIHYVDKYFITPIRLTTPHNALQSRTGVTKIAIFACRMHNNLVVSRENMMVTSRLHERTKTTCDIPTKVSSQCGLRLNNVLKKNPVRRTMLLAAPSTQSQITTQEEIINTLIFGGVQH